MIDKAEAILKKETIDVKDYNNFMALEKEMKTDYDKYYYLWLLEGFQLRLPEIAAKVGNYSFIKDDV